MTATNAAGPTTHTRYGLQGAEGRADRAAPRPQPDERLARLWEEHLRAPFPAGFRGVDIEGVELILVDADVAGPVRRALNDGGLDDDDIAVLWACVAGLDKIVPLIGEEYCASYFARLRTMARQAVAPHLPAAT